MNPAIISALVRHLLTVAGGGFLVSWGIDGSAVEAIAGAVATLAGVAWSVYDKKKMQ
jgi:O-antigen/teichoic acid export membrane protein